MSSIRAKYQFKSLCAALARNDRIQQMSARFPTLSIGELARTTAALTTFNATALDESISRTGCSECKGLNGVPGTRSPLRRTRIVDPDTS